MNVPDSLRLAELIAALSLATDLGMGQPLEQALRTCIIALGLGERLGLRGEELREVYYVSLLRFLGCTADASEMAEMAGGDEIGLRASIAPVLGGKPGELLSQVLPRVGSGHGPFRRAQLVVVMMRTGRHRARGGVRAHCEVAENLAQRLGLGTGVRAGLGAAFEQWNGEGFPKGVAREDIRLSARALRRVEAPLEAVQAALDHSNLATTSIDRSPRWGARASLGPSQSWPEGHLAEPIGKLRSSLTLTTADAVK